MKKNIAIGLLCAMSSALKAQNTFPTTGNVGIGTNNPSGVLSLGGNILNRKLLIYDGITEAGGFGQASSELRIFAPVSGINHISLGRYDLGSDSFLEQMRVDYNGNVGIGTNSPTAKLDIDGGIYAETGESHFSVGTYIDPVVGIAFGVKVGSNGIAVNGNSVFNNGLSIGTPNLNGYLLAIKGNVHAQQVVVELSNFPDYVFKPTYQLKPLSEVKTYIDLNHHLPDMPSSAEVEKDGLNLGEMNKLLTKKVEELTLYLIEKDRKEQEQAGINKEMKDEIFRLRQQMNTILKQTPDK